MKEFVFKNTDMLTWSGVKLDLNLVTVTPAIGKTLSEAVDVVGTHIHLHVIAGN